MIKTNSILYFDNLDRLFVVISVEKDYVYLEDPIDVYSIRRTFLTSYLAFESVFLIGEV